MEKKVLNLSYEQKGIYIDCIKGSSVEYNNVVTVSVSKLDNAAFRRAIEMVVNEQELLRASFTELHGEPKMVIHESAEVPVAFSDMKGMSMDEINREIISFSSEEFSLESSSLFAVKIIESDEDKFFIVLKVHHLVSDGTSMSILLKDLFRYYNAVRSDESIEITVDTGFSAYTAKQEQLSSTPKFEKKRNSLSLILVTLTIR